MAEPDLDVVIRRNAKEQHRTLMDAAKKRRDHFLAVAAKAKDKAGRDRHKQLAKEAVLQGAAIARRLQMSAENAADSYARAMKKAAEQVQAEAPKQVQPKTDKKKAAVKKKAKR